MMLELGKVYPLLEMSKANPRKYLHIKGLNPTTNEATLLHVYNIDAIDEDMQLGSDEKIYYATRRGGYVFVPTLKETPTNLVVGRMYSEDTYAKVYPDCIAFADVHTADEKGMHIFMCTSSFDMGESVAGTLLDAGAMFFDWPTTGVEDDSPPFQPGW